jgi:small GTP-binding protein
MKRVRAVFCGEQQVGKSSIIHRFANKTFRHTASTVAGAFRSALVQYDNEVVSMELWDTAGSERYHSVIPSFFKNASVIVVVYDVTKRATFDRFEYWLQFARDNSPEDALTFLVGNKIDLFGERVVGLEEGLACAERNQFVGLVETSAKTGEAIDTLFAHLAATPGCGTVEIDEKEEVIVLTNDRKRSTCC